MQLLKKSPAKAGGARVRATGDVGHAEETPPGTGCI
jgi:hypothetical protein